MLLGDFLCYNTYYDIGNYKGQKEDTMVDIIIILIGLIGLILIWIMLYDSNRFVVVQHSFEHAKIVQPYRAVVLADLHNKKYGTDNDKLLQAIREEQPDGIFIAGDMITATKSKSIKGVLEFLEELAKEYPIYYGNGNHEYRIKLYPEKYGDMAKEIDDSFAEMKINHLINSHITLKNYGISIYGLEIAKEYYQRFKVYPMEAGYLPGLLGNPMEDTFNILLAHNPEYFPQYAHWGTDLVVSGHIHGGMVRLPFGKGRGVVSPMVKLFPKYDGGVFREERSTMLLSRGLGTHTIPIRLFNPGELIVINLLPKEGTDVLVEQNSKNR